MSLFDLARTRRQQQKAQDKKLNGFYKSINYQVIYQQEVDDKKVN